jgi:hypothetical protein
MNYAKPEITSLASASFAIQGGMGKSVLNNPDTTEPNKTPAAYEADE